MSIALVCEAGLSKYPFTYGEMAWPKAQYHCSVSFTCGHVWPGWNSEGCKVECTGRIFKEGAHATGESIKYILTSEVFFNVPTLSVYKELVSYKVSCRTQICSAKRIKQSLWQHSVPCSGILVQYLCRKYKTSVTHPRSAVSEVERENYRGGLKSALRVP